MDYGYFKVMGKMSTLGSSLLILQVCFLKKETTLFSVYFNEKVDILNQLSQKRKEVS